MKKLIMILSLLIFNPLQAADPSVIGYWKLTSVTQGNVDLSEGETLKDFWHFHENGTVEFNDMLKGKVQRNYAFENNVISIKSQDWRPDGNFKVTSLNDGTMTWEIESFGAVMTYHLEKQK